MAEAPHFPPHPHVHGAAADDQDDEVVVQQGGDPAAAVAAAAAAQPGDDDVDPQDNIISLWEFVLRYCDFEPPEQPFPPDHATAIWNFLVQCRIDMDSLIANVPFAEPMETDVIDVNDDAPQPQPGDQDALLPLSQPGQHTQQGRSKMFLELQLKMDADPFRSMPCPTICTASCIACNWSGLGCCQQNFVLI